jgi:hypothetical protein
LFRGESGSAKAKPLIMHNKWLTAAAREYHLMEARPGRFWQENTGSRLAFD